MLIYGHRGVPSLFPENTLPSFQKAIALGADGVELDIRKTLDNELIVIHDATLDRTTSGTGLVSESTVDQIKSLESEIEIPTLYEAIDALQGYKILIEIKEPNLESLVFEEIENVINDVVIMSFDARNLVRMKRFDENIRTGLIIGPHGRFASTFELMRVIEADFLVPSYRGNQQMIKYAQNKKYPVIAWDIPDRKGEYEWCMKALNGMIIKNLDSPVLKGIINVI